MRKWVGLFGILCFCSVGLSVRAPDDVHDSAHPKGHKRPGRASHSPRVAQQRFKNWNDLVTKEAERRKRAAGPNEVSSTPFEDLVVARSLCFKESLETLVRELDKCVAGLQGTNDQLQKITKALKASRFISDKPGVPALVTNLDKLVNNEKVESVSVAPLIELLKSNNVKERLAAANYLAGLGTLSVKAVKNAFKEADADLLRHLNTIWRERWKLPENISAEEAQAELGRKPRDSVYFDTSDNRNAYQDCLCRAKYQYDNVSCVPVVIET